MKLIDAQTFISYPEGTVYSLVSTVQSKNSACNTPFQNIKVKGQTTQIGWAELDVVNACDYDEPRGFVLNHAKWITRPFDEQQLFLVLEELDVHTIRSSLDLATKLRKRVDKCQQ